MQRSEGSIRCQIFQREVVPNQLADEIEAELRRLKLWNDQLSLRTIPRSAFGADQLSFEEWLQVVLVPRLRDVSAHHTVPTTSNLAVAGIRNFDGMANADTLIELLAAVDAHVQSLPRP